MKSRKPLTHLIENWENIVCQRDDQSTNRQPHNRRRIAGTQQSAPGSLRTDLKERQEKNGENGNADKLHRVRAVSPARSLSSRSETAAGDGGDGDGASGIVPTSLPTKTEALDVEEAVRRILRTELSSKEPVTVVRGLAKLANGCGGIPVPANVEPTIKARYEEVVFAYARAVAKLNGDYLVLHAMQEHVRCVQVQTMGCRVLSWLTGGRCEETARAVTHAVSNGVQGGVSFILRVMSSFVDCAELQLAGLATTLNIMLCDDKQWASILACGGVARVVSTLLHHPDNPLIQMYGCNILCLPDDDGWLREVAAASGGLTCVIRGLRVGLDDANLLFNGLGVLVHTCDKCDAGSAVIEAGGLGLTIEVMRQHASDVGLQLAGLEAMCLIAETNYESSLPLLVHLGGIHAIVHAMRVCADQADVQYNACSLLSILCRTQPYRSLVLRAGGIAVVTAAYDAFKMDDEVQRRACQVMTMLSGP